MPAPVHVHWFRHDLRLKDNPALAAAAKEGSVLCIYIHQNHFSKKHIPGEARQWWTHHSLASLNKSIDNKLAFYSGDPADVFKNILERFPIASVHFNEAASAHQRQTDQSIEKLLSEQDIECTIHSGCTLWPIGEILKDDGTPYRVFTPFFKKGCLKAEPPRLPMRAPSLSLVHDKFALSLTECGILPTHAWTKKMNPHWEIGEAGAHKQLKRFIQHGLQGYKEGRNFPAQEHVSRLSPHLQYGEISPNTVWYAAQEAGDSDDIQHFLSELGWREFSYQLLFHNPKLAEKNLQSKFDAFPWSKSAKKLTAWQKGLTGIPIVDAGMRELWATGYMHNRVRMIVGSFLVKNCLLDWRDGERWFWDCLVDADAANNSASWQWIAGCGADAAPYFRIFNPVTQGQKFDPDGDYTRHWVPELAKCPDLYLFNPWEAPTDLLSQAGIILGKTYPEPIVDLKASREEALAAFQSLKNNG
ncbi:MAG: deoxyribodipyrimidine photolyase [Legionellales bacterium]|nr:deoxyribodipyrimidine photolyase [Legionellales bacterium]